ncbi:MULTISPECIES: hypothetical protein [Maricaulis]|uniref:hypothetical protein n=1 Tax=Maricaulis TaxID=74317 RepID=UPI003A8D6FD5|tara:strand:+ start:2817 stop:3137 length:321 start_codon:yes stop_codon:yes gene_type:complete
MEDHEIDRLLRGLKDRSTVPQPGAFESDVWRKIRQSAGWPERMMAGWHKLAPTIAWRAAPAALALIIGGISGAALSAPQSHDELDVFRANSSYLIASRIDTQEARH